MEILYSLLVIIVFGLGGLYILKWSHERQERKWRKANPVILRGERGPEDYNVPLNAISSLLTDDKFVTIQIIKAPTILQENASKWRNERNLIELAYRILRDAKENVKWLYDRHNVERWLALYEWEVNNRRADRFIHISMIEEIIKSPGFLSDVEEAINDAGLDTSELDEEDCWDAVYNESELKQNFLNVLGRYLIIKPNEEFKQSTSD